MQGQRDSLESRGRRVCSYPSTVPSNPVGSTCATVLGRGSTAALRAINRDEFRQVFMAWDKLPTIPGALHGLHPWRDDIPTAGAKTRLTQPDAVRPPRSVSDANRFRTSACSGLASRAIAIGCNALGASMWTWSAPATVRIAERAGRQLECSVPMRRESLDWTYRFLHASADTKSPATRADTVWIIASGANGAACARRSRIAPRL